MKAFGYWSDPLCITAVIAYGLNRWFLKPFLASPFLHGRFNDLWLIPAALPVVLWIQRKVGLRKNDSPPSWMEVLMHLVVWSVICEFIGPRLLHHGTADAWDVVAYAAGGIAAAMWWNRPQVKRCIQRH